MVQLEKLTKAIISIWENKCVKAKAFTLLEILLVMVVIGIIATMTIPRLIRKDPSSNWESVTDEMNNLVYYARQEAISNQNVYRLHFKENDDGKNIVQVEVEAIDKEHPDKKIYNPIKPYYFTPTYKFPESIEISAIYHGKEEELSGNRQHAYCYVISNGLVQETTIHLLRKENNKESKVSLKMLPFFGRFELLEGFVK